MNTKIEIIGKKNSGRPRVFESEDVFLISVEEYIMKCKENAIFPSIAGFCSNFKIHRTTFYDLKSQFPYTYKKVDCIFEDAMINSKGASDRIKILYLRNKYARNYRKAFIQPEPNDKIDLTIYNDDEVENLRNILKKLGIVI